MTAKPQTSTLGDREGSTLTQMMLIGTTYITNYYPRWYTQPPRTWALIHCKTKVPARQKPNPRRLDTAIPQRREPKNQAAYSLVPSDQ